MNKRAIVALKVAVWLVCLTPLVLLIYHGFTNDLGPDPTPHRAQTHSPEFRRRWNQLGHRLPVSGDQN